MVQLRVASSTCSTQRTVLRFKIMSDLVPDFSTPYLVTVNGGKGYLLQTTAYAIDDALYVEVWTLRESRRGRFRKVVPECRRKSLRLRMLSRLLGGVDWLCGGLHARNKGIFKNIGASRRGSSRHFFFNVDVEKNVKLKCEGEDAEWDIDCISEDTHIAKYADVQEAI